MDADKLLSKLADLGIQGGKKIAEVTADAIDAVTPVIADTGEKAVSFLNQATDRNVDESEYDLKLLAAVDQFEKGLVIHILQDGKEKYTLRVVNKFFSSQMVLYGRDDFEIGYVKMKENARRHGKSESNPIDFEIYMGQQQISMIRSVKGEKTKRTYMYGEWKIERPVLGKDFYFSDCNGNRIAVMKQETNIGDYRVLVKEPKDEIRVLFALAAMEYEYVK